MTCTITPQDKEENGREEASALKVCTYVHLICSHFYLITSFGLVMAKTSYITDMMSGVLNRTAVINLNHGCYSTETDSYSPVHVLHHYCYVHIMCSNMVILPTNAFIFY